MEYRHTPVMLKEVLELASVKTGDKVIDCTLGGAGYTLAIAKRVGEQGKVLAIDLDPSALANAQQLLTANKLHNVVLLKGNFAELANLVPKQFSRIDGIVMDLGLSSSQLDDPGRGFSFRREAPLKMSFGAAEEESRTEVIVNKFRAEDLTRILKDYGEERWASRIAKSIVAARPLTTTGELVKAIERGVPAAYRHGRLHFATRTFQALRIATNDELNNLRRVLPQALTLLKGGGRLVVVSFHSLEDRIVKDFFRQAARGCICHPQAPRCVCGFEPQVKLLTTKAVKPSAAEISANPRAASGRLRAISKL